MTDWFVDGYYSSAADPANGGHFSAGTNGIYTLDEETLPAKDSSVYFVRKLQTSPKSMGGLGQPLVSPTVKGEWCHFNGGKKYEDGTGGVASNTNNKFAPAPVRGDKGVPDSGIGPAKIIAELTKILNHVPPGGKGRHGVWGREVSKGVFNAATRSENVRFLYFNPGHEGAEWTDAGGWMADLFMSSLRWTAKEDLGCTDNTRANFNPLATINDGTCTPTGIRRDAVLSDGLAGELGRISVRGLDLDVSVNDPGFHSVTIVGVNGRLVFNRQGEGRQAYQVASLPRGFYMAYVKVGGQAFKKMVSVQ